MAIPSFKRIAQRENIYGLLYHATAGGAGFVTFDKQTKKHHPGPGQLPDPIGVVNFYKYSVVINGVPDKRFQTSKTVSPMPVYPG